MFNVLDYANNEDLSGAVLLVDLYKAFDSLAFYLCYAKTIWFWELID